ncbi:SIMPL domain-containing protein [Halomonas halocynthiae]|uniref:SIMPL domain-containing protein n=1 Tax=Halomonas halocynthiae TaxID=176290 RepID=UPI00041F339C|nr:SIMPL domain-containing protein [Halomonas halocynthiae]
MQQTGRTWVVSASILGLCLLLGLAALGYQLGSSAIEYKQMDRVVTVKGLSEREYPADVVIWPIQFTEASNNLEALYASLERSTGMIRDFLESRGIASEDIGSSAPAINDRSAQTYSSGDEGQFRYTASQTVTVYSDEVDNVRELMQSLSALGKQGIVFTGGGYDAQVEYLFTRLNDVKPDMIEEATRKAREVAEKFAEDSDSRLGKIRNASQGQFSISPRDTNNPQIKQVRVVSTVEYYLAD